MINFKMGNISKCTFLKRSYAKDQHIHKKMLSATNPQENKNQHHNDLFTTVPLKRAIIKKTKNSKCW